MHAQKVQNKGYDSVIGEVAAKTLWLPPPDARLINPKKEKIDTPTDERGLIDVPRLLSDVKATVDPTYEWPALLSVHHLYWPDAWYNRSPTTHNNPGMFRNLPIHKALLPRVFENWLHQVTLPPKVPEPDVMRYRIDAWNVARSLFTTARETIAHERLIRRRRAYIAANPDVLKAEFNGEDRIGEEYIQEVYEKNFRSWEHALVQNERVPIEFRLIDIDNPPETIAKNLGKLVMPTSMQLTRAVVEM